jgi:hypothetical protein
MQGYRRDLSVDVDDGSAPSIVVNHRVRSTRAAELQPTSSGGMSHEQMRRLRYLMSRLQDIAVVPKSDNMLKYKFFMIWAEKFPLYQKCDELAKQLQERTQALTIMKESYLRDVIR